MPSEVACVLQVTSVIATSYSLMPSLHHSLILLAFVLESLSGTRLSHFFSLLDNYSYLSCVFSIFSLNFFFSFIPQTFLTINYVPEPTVGNSIMNKRHFPCPGRVHSIVERWTSK